MIEKKGIDEKKMKDKHEKKSKCKKKRNKNTSKRRRKNMILRKKKTGNIWNILPSSRHCLGDWRTFFLAARTSVDYQIKYDE